MISGLVLPSQFLEDVEQLLHRFLENTGVTIVLFLDESGQLVSYKGEAESVNLPSLAALVASDMSAVAEIARQIGEKDTFKLLIHEGDAYNILTCAVREKFFLVSIFKTVVPIGLVRLYSKVTVNNLRRLVEELGTIGTQIAPIVGVDFTTSLADELERAFGE